MNNNYIIYALVANNHHVVAEYIEYAGNVIQVAYQVLKVVRETKHKSGILVVSSKKFHFIKEDNKFILCLSEDVTNDNAFNFLNDIKKSIDKNYSNDQFNTCMNNNDFNKDLKELIQYYNDYYNPRPNIIEKNKNIFKSIYEEDLSKLIGRKITLVVNYNNTDPGNIPNFDNSVSILNEER